jgi:hypothetical protein
MQVARVVHHWIPTPLALSTSTCQAWFRIMLAEVIR